MAATVTNDQGYPDPVADLKAEALHLLRAAAPDQRARLLAVAESAVERTPLTRDERIALLTLDLLRPLLEGPGPA